MVKQVGQDDIGREVGVSTHLLLDTLLFMHLPILRLVWNVWFLHFSVPFRDQGRCSLFCEAFPHLCPQNPKGCDLSCGYEECLLVWGNSAGD